MVRPNLQPIGYLLLLRAKIGLRFIKELGWIRSSVIFFAIPALFLPIFEVLNDQNAAIYLTVFDVSILLGIHLYRRDQHFIQSIGVHKQLLYFAEYLLISIPALILLGYIEAWLWILLLMGVCAHVSTISVTPKTGRRSKQALLLPLSLPIEWASGLRSQKWMLTVFLIAGFTLIFFYLFAGWIFIFFITVAVMHFYRYCEPVQFILLQNKTPLKFLCQKLFQGICYYGILTSFLWVQMIILYPQQTVWSLLFLLANMMLLVTVIAGKYAFYRENMNIEMMISIIFWYGCICLLVPYLPPVLLLLFVWLLVRGYKRLKWEVYAFH